MSILQGKKPQNSHIFAPKAFLTSKASRTHMQVDVIILTTDHSALRYHTTYTNPQKHSNYQKIIDQYDLTQLQFMKNPRTVRFHADKDELAYMPTASNNRGQDSPPLPNGLILKMEMIEQIQYFAEISDLDFSSRIEIQVVQEYRLREGRTKPKRVSRDF